MTTHEIEAAIKTLDAYKKFLISEQKKLKKQEEEARKKLPKYRGGCSCGAAIYSNEILAMAYRKLYPTRKRQCSYCLGISEKVEKQIATEKELPQVKDKWQKIHKLERELRRKGV